MMKSFCLLLLSFIGVFFGNSVFSVAPESIYFTNSIFSVLLFFVLFILLRYALSQNKQNRILHRPDIASFCSVVFVLCMMVGRQLENNENLTINLSFLLGLIVWIVITDILLHCIWEILQNRLPVPLRSSESDEFLQETAYVHLGKKSISVDILTFFGLFVAYGTVLLAVYPGFFVYDAVDEWMQVETGIYTTHHPLPHVLILGGIIKLVHKLTGSYNAGIAFFTFLQIIFFSLMFTYVLSSLRKESRNIKSHLLFSLYYMLFPVISMYVLCSTKDSLFSAFLVLLFFLTRKLILQPDTFFSNRKNTVMFIISACFTMILRYNALYAFFIFAVIFVICFKRLQKRENLLFPSTKKLILIMVTPIIGTLVINCLLPVLLHASPSEKQELLTVPISQLARVYHFDKEELSENDVRLLETYIPEEYLEGYTARLSDPVKYGFNNEYYRENSADFFALWAKIGLQHPLGYLNAWLYTSYGFWYPDAVINVYRGHNRYTFTYEESSYFGYETEEPGIRNSKIPALDKVFKKLSLELTQQRIPVISMLFSPGFMFVLYLFLTGFFTYIGQIKRVFSYILLGLVWLTYLLGPTYLVRYVVFLWFALPILMTDFLAVISKKEK